MRELLRMMSSSPSIYEKRKNMDNCVWIWRKGFLERNENRAGKLN